MWEDVHLVLDTILAIIAAALVFRADVLRLLRWRCVMRKEWENVLGQMVLFSEDASGGWSFECYDLGVAQDAKVRYPTQQAARLAVASMVFAFFVTEEVTSAPVPPTTSGPAASPRLAGPTVPPGLPQGGGRR